MSLVDDYTIEERPGTEERHDRGVPRDRGAPRLCRGAPNMGGYGGPFQGPHFINPRDVSISAPPQKRRNVVIVLAVQRAVALGACLAEASPPCGRRARRRRAARGARCARQVHHLAGRLEL